MYVLSREILSSHYFANLTTLRKTTEINFKFHVFSLLFCPPLSKQNLGNNVAGRWRFISMELLNEAYRIDLHFPIHFGRFGPVSTQAHQNGRAWCKSYGHLRAKSKHGLWLADLKASLSNSIEKFIYKT